MMPRFSISMAVAMEDLTGKHVRGLELLETIGSGGFGVVYRAYQPTVDREVAVKVILPEFAEHPDFVARFEAEARTVAKLEHPHIVPLYDYWRDDESAYLVMRFIRGGSLRDELESSGALPLEQVRQAFNHICDALQAAHDQGVIHRDLKPENILRDERGDVYLTDFGIAKDLSAEGLTKTGGLMGSAAYIAPELAQNVPVTPATDVYSLGVLLYELVTGEHPFPDQTLIQLVQSHLNEPLPAAVEKRPDLPPGIDEIIQRATAKAPGDRYPSVEALSQDLFRAFEAPERAPRTDLPAFLQGEPDRVIETFVGRTRELQWLRAQLDSALEGRGRVAFVTGGPGQGKTALISAFARRAREQHPNLAVAFGSANAFSGLGDPYLPFRDVLGMLTGNVEARWASGQLSTEQARALWELTPSTVEAIVEHGPELVNVFVGGREITERAAAAGSSEGSVNELRALSQKNLSGERGVQQTQLFEQFSNVLRALAAKVPLLILLDDLQWADGASISLLFHLGRRIESARILILGTYREEEVALGRDGARHPLEKVVGEFRQTLGNVLLELEEQEREESRHFLDELLDTEPNELSEFFRSALYERTGGHPLFSIELLRSMQERGDLIRDEQGRWVEGPALKWDQLPEKVEAVIRERITRLDNELRELLSVASVEGETFTAEVVARVQEMQERPLLRQLSQELEKRHNLIREQGEARVGAKILTRYRFSHQLIQRYIYNELGSGERRILHREVAQTLEELYRDQLDEITVQLARHYLVAGDYEQAISYLRSAGDRARRLHANSEALGLYNQALELSDEEQTLYADLLAARAAAFVNLYQGEEAVQDFESLLNRARTHNDQHGELEALLGLARGNYIVALDHPETGSARASKDFYEQAYELAEQLDDPRGMIRALVPTTWFTDFWSDFEDQARANAEQALRLSESTGDEMLVLEAELAMFYTDPLLERQRRGDRLRLQLEDLGDLVRLNYLLFGMMFSTLQLGEFEQTVAHCNRGVELAHRIGVPPVQYPTLRAIALARLGRFKEAFASLEEEVSDESHPFANTFMKLGRVIIYFELQAYRQAAELLQSLRQPMEELARAWMLDSFHMYMTRVVLEGGLQDEFDLKPSLSYLENMDTPLAMVALGGLAAAEGKLELALSLAERALVMAESTGRRPDASMALELKAWVLLLCKQAEEALRAADKGISLAEKIGYRPMVWRLSGTRAEVLEQLGRGAAALEERERAGRLIRELASGVSDDQLRQTFLGSAAVRSILMALGE